MVALVPSIKTPTADVVPVNVNVPPLVTAAFESIVRSGAVPEVSLMPPAARIVSGFGSVLVLCAEVATLSTGAAARAGEDKITAVAAESMRVRLFKSNLL